MLIDTHAHLDFPELNSDLPSVLERAARAGVTEIITIGIDLACSREAIHLAHSHPHIYATVGIHPHDAFIPDEEAMRIFMELARERKVVAIGEMGLDFYRDRQPRPIQRKCLLRQLEAACELGLPGVFHVREAYDDFLEIITPYAPLLKTGVLHCFSGTWEIARRCLDMGFYLSIPGTVTFPKSLILQEVVRRAPLDRLLLETDAPYLAPVPYRGKVNEPSYVVHTARKVAELRNLSLDEISERTTRNAREAFGIESASRRDEVS